jgi:hypothetical protein
MLPVQLTSWIVCCAAGVLRQEGPASPPSPALVTHATLADPVKLAELERPGEVLFEDGFEAEDSLARYFEVRGAKDGRALRTTDAALAHAGSGALQLTSPASEGNSSGAGVSGWLGDGGHERVHLRYYLKFAADYDQGNLNHTGGCLVGVAGHNKWAGMGTAGILPKGDDHFSSSFETWRDWGRSAPPGFAHLYTYWMEMQRDKDDHYRGNNLGPEPERRIVPARGRWTCFEVMVRANDIGQSNGELAAWIDGKLYVHYTGFRWRSSAEVLLKRFGLDVYVHRAERTNVAWYDDVAVSSGYIGPLP